MAGDDRIRSCSLCNQTVYNLAELTRPEAEQLLTRSLQGRVCVRLFRRQDGRVMTRDCNLGWARAAGRQFAVLAAGAIGMLFLLVGWLGDRPGDWRSAKERSRALPIIGATLDWLDPQRPAVMGEMCVPPAAGNPDDDSDDEEVPPQRNPNEATK
jgi:hypothetical protein